MTCICVSRTAVALLQMITIRRVHTYMYCSL